jgi:LysM domain
MKLHLGLLPAVFFLASCDREQPASGGNPERSGAQAQSGGYLAPKPDWSESDYSGWMTRAELQHLQDLSPPERYFAYVEGRNNGGVAEFRAVTRDLATAEFTQWAVFWGIDEQELFDWELRLLRSGFVRKSMQVFLDSTGKAVHQVVWLRPVGATDNLSGDVIVASPPEATVSESGEGDGQAALLPHEGDVVPVAPILVEPEEARVSDQPETKVYTVMPGDTLGGIAKMHKTTVASIKAKNGLRSDIISVGQKLKIH